MESITTRSCLNPQCSQENPQPTTQFRRKKGGRDGLDSFCKHCRNAMLREWKRANPEKARAISQRERVKNAERYRVTKAAYHQVNAMAIRARVRAWQDAHPERARELKRSHYERHRELYRQRAHAWAKAHPDVVRDMQRQYRLTHPDVYRQSASKWRAAHPLERANNLRVWRAKNPERVALHQAKRYRLMRNAPGAFTQQHVQLKLELQEGKCYYCGVPLDDFHVEHKVTLSKGGTNWPANICCSCPSCNSRKHDYDFWDFLRLIR